MDRVLAPQQVQPAVIESQHQELLVLDLRVDEAEGEGLRARWEFGQALLRRRVGKKLPIGLLDELARKTGKSRAELKQRVRFAETYQTSDALAKGLANLTSWNEFVNGKRHVEHNSGENEWYTPAEYVDTARLVMGGIDLDPASSGEANEVVRATTYYTLEDDGLRRDWSGRVWMNPPYARPLIDEFCGKLAESYAQGGVTQACVMANNATETGWFHALAEVAGAICFPRQRVRFWQPNRETATGLQGQAVFYLGESVEAFRSEFLRFGFTVVP